MKIRRGFVTNSSSSSFIIAFNSEDEIDDVIRNAVTNSAPEADCWTHMTDEEFAEHAITYALREIKDEKVTLEEVKQILVEEFQSRARWELYYSTRRYYTDRGEYLNSEEYKKKEREFVEEHVKDAMASLKNKKYISYASFSDNDGCIGSYLEHNLIPYLEETVCSFNHH